MKEQILIFGLGHIGGSIAKSLCKQGIRVYAEDLSKKTIRYGIKNKIIKGTFSDLDLSRPYSIIFSTPPIVTNKLVNENKDLIKNAVLFTETSSTKNKIKNNAFINKIENAILSHPIAGNEGSGIDASDIKLFENKICILSPLKMTSKNSITKTQKLWESLGSNCIKMDLNSHDKILAATSHLPHVISFSLMRYIEKSSNIKNKILMGGGLKDFTRISSSDPEMWSDIFDLNKKEILNSIKGFKKELEVMEKNILRSRSKTKNLIAESNKARKKIID